ncbi:MAG: (d)CMP kinase [Saprospiraceae bacterium]|nr:(d)CMP kinase [Saprospiraceae bacterium]
MPEKKVIIAIDGYSACGKSTLAKDLARSLNIRYLDSGSLYRAITLFCIQHVIHPEDIKSVVAALPFIHLNLSLGENIKLTMNNEDITDEIRKTDVSRWVSEVSVISEVRNKVNEILRGLGKTNSLVMDGRDIGTVVFPNADLKFFVTADVNIRTLRRQKELEALGRQITLQHVKENLLHRDNLDSTRMDSPLSKAEDAIIIDNTNLNREEQLELALDWYNSSLNG